MEDENNNIDSKEMKKQEKKSKLSKEQIKIEELEKEVEELKNDFLRSRADFENYRKRKEKELMDARDNAVIDFVQSLLPSIDNFEMSLKMTDNKEMFIKGVKMIHKNLIDTLKEHHFMEFEPKIGEHFNPYIHDPVLIEHHSKDAGKVLGTIKKGYKHKEKVIRTARVQVKKEEQKKN